MAEPAPAKYIAEFLGTFMLVFTIGCNVLSGQPVWGGVSIACVLTVMIYALGGASGANFNPAVSVALGITKKMEGEWKEVAIYSVCQIAGGITAGLCYLAMFGKSFNLEPAKGHSALQAGLAELLYTFMLCFVVLNVAASGRHGGKNEFYGLAIGFVIVAGAYSAGTVSGGCFNPAVAIGIDVSSAYHGVYYCFIYTLWELVGAALAAFAYKLCRDAQDEVAANSDATAAEIEEATPEGAKLFSEFIGTYFLILTVGLNVISASPAAAFSIAAALMCMIFALGSVSGAHFNPAVTVALICGGRGKCEASAGVKYIIAQIFGGICAAFTYSFLKGGETFALKPATSDWSGAIVGEAVFTFTLCFVVLSVASVKNVLTEFFGFAIGMCVTVGGFAVGKVSGGSFNPAVSIGITVGHGGDFQHCMIYCLVELLAGAAAVGVFKLTQPSEYDLEKQ